MFSTAKTYKAKSANKSGTRNGTANSDSFIQPKLKVGKPGDVYEAEADSMAETVVERTHNKPEAKAQSFFPPAPSNTVQAKSEAPFIQEKPLAASVTPVVQLEAAEEESVQEKCADCEKEVQKMPFEDVQKQEEEEAQAKENIQLQEEEEAQAQEEEEAQTKENIQLQEEEEAQAQEEEEAQPKEDIQLQEEEEAQAQEEEEAQPKEDVQLQEEEEAQAQEEEEAQTKAINPSPPKANISKKINDARGKGSPLKESAKNQMESGFGADFSGVRVHTDSNAAEMNKDLGAKAFTAKNDIFFNEGQFNPASKEGQTLLAHELTHTLQQGASKAKEEVPGETPVPDQKSEGKPEAAAVEEAPVEEVPTEEGAVPAEEGQEALAEGQEGEGAKEGKEGEEGKEKGKGKKEGKKDVKTTPRSPKEDPNFKKMEGRVEDRSTQQQTHEEPAASAGAAQSAAVSPGNERASMAQAGQVDQMEEAEAGEFSAEDFKAKLMERIESMQLPANQEEADDFEDNNNIDEVNQAAMGDVQGEQAAASGAIEQTSQAEPNTEAIPEREVTPLPEPPVGGPPAGVNPDKAMPPKRGAAEVETPLQENSAEVDQQMADNEITEEQLANSNEPQFQEALGAKKSAQEDAATRPTQLRQQEAATRQGAQVQASANADASLQGMHQDRANLLNQVSTDQQTTGTTDTAERQRIADEINTIYENTKTDVETILGDLDKEVSDKFSAGTATAKAKFENYVDRKMTAYKRRRYSGVIGKGKWLKDKFAGMPDEVNEFFVDGKKEFINHMDTVITEVSNLVASKLNEAKTRINTGKQEVQDYVSALPENLQQIGKDAADEISNKFDSLEESVNSKQEELVDKLANQYNDALKEVDARIEEMKAANRGLIDMALDAIGGVIKTIIQIKNMLTSLLAGAISAIKSIIADPIGFLGNLISGIGQGFTNFGANIMKHLQSGLIQWLTGTLGPVGITIPDDLFSLKGIFSLVAQILGLTWDFIRRKAVKLLGEPMVQALETGFEIFMIIKDKGLDGLWEYLKDQFNDLKETVIDAIKSMVITTVIEAGIKWVLGLMNPASAFVKACMMIIDVVRFFIERGSQIIALVQAFVDGVKAVASGNVSAVAKAVENALARALPVVIGFLASLLGIGGLARKVQKIIGKIRKRIDKAVDKLIMKAKAAFNKLISKKKPKKGAAKKIKDDNKNQKPGKITSADRKKHKKIADAIEKKLKQPAKKGEKFEDFHKRKKKEANALEDKYQPQLKKGINLDLKIGSVASDEKDGDVDIKLKIAPNDEVRDIAALVGDEQLTELANQGKAKFGATGAIASKLWKKFVMDKTGDNKNQEEYKTRKMRSKDPPLIYHNGGRSDKSFFSFNKDEFTGKKPPDLLALSKDYDGIKSTLKLTATAEWPAKEAERTGAKAVTQAQVDKFREKIRDEILTEDKYSRDMATLNDKILKSNAIPGKLNRLRGDIFERWLSQRGSSKSAYAENPQFFKTKFKTLQTSTKRVADGYVGTELREAKVAKNKRSPGESEIKQMQDYHTILSSGDATWVNAAGTTINFNAIRYVLNDQDTADLWYDDENSPIRTNLKGYAQKPLVGS